MTRYIQSLPETWQALVADGWVHVTGLPAYGGSGSKGAFDVNYVINGQHELCCINHNNSTSVIYLEDGSVWLKVGYSSSPLTVRVACEGGYVPCSNGEILNWRDVMERIVNPNWNKCIRV